MSVNKEQVEILSPCPITLDRSAVRPEDRKMHCDHCVKDVHMLSNMSEREARDFLSEHAGEDICVSYAVQRDGQIRFRREPPLVPVSALRPRTRAPMPASPGRPGRVARIASTLGTAILLAACAPHSNTSAIQSDMGETQTVRDLPVIPVEQPCDPEDEMLVEGGIKAQPIHEPEPIQEVAGGLRPMTEEEREALAEPPPKPQPLRGRVRPTHLPKTEG